MAYISLKNMLTNASWSFTQFVKVKKLHFAGVSLLKLGRVWDIGVT